MSLEGWICGVTTGARRSKSNGGTLCCLTLKIAWSDRSKHTQYHPASQGQDS